ncbi:class I SAM-dependent methyltransferase [Acetivibrio clariflavus]|uniref:Methylase involved in ubiquinone/menaquinone biosynthesis n=1 Tax=Acetivibrio clariflavus (strain DSM 19732 / NBRC 101661 / EBR45) TaxID=720554 RepID=G8M0W1_ACECE|nr:methyltransferase domain-containing protein [Acetivibrio clariflavus]AEV70204.1 methylase involved in ubiquinone/menaquinone biosynthesis [Acetivibrio clariflavus DSM 19732]
MDYFEQLMEEIDNYNFSGWDFSYILETGRMQEVPVKWNYFNKIKPYLYNVKRLLDLGTGGGERLSKFTPLPQETYATEGYKPNVEIARKKLEPLGIRVIEVDGNEENSKLPFDDNFFDLIIDRHESYCSQEIYRILADDAHFITQQVGSLTIVNLIQLLDNKGLEISNWNLNYAEKELKENNFEIVNSIEEISFIRFYDVGALGIYIKAFPWVFPEFTAKKYEKELMYIHNSILNEGYIDIVYHLFFIDAKKKGF